MALANNTFTTDQLSGQLARRGLTGVDNLIRPTLGSMGLTAPYTADDVKALETELRKITANTAPSSPKPAPPIAPAAEQNDSESQISDEHFAAMKVQADQYLNQLIQVGAEYVAKQTPVAMKSMFEIGLSQGFNQLPAANFTEEGGEKLL